MMKRSKAREQVLTLLKSEIEDLLKKEFLDNKFRVHLSITDPHVVDVEWKGGPSEREVRDSLRFPLWKEEYRLMEVSYSRKDG
jgi:hypothetical protein